MHKTLFILALLTAANANTLAAEATPGHPTAPPAGHGMSAQTPLPNKGEALEVIDAGDYTYIRVQDAGKETWVAVSRTSVKEGDMVHYSQGNLMRNFKSKALDRVFEEVIFAGGIQVDSAHPTVAQTADILNLEAEGEKLANQGRVLNTIPSGAYTYIEVDQEGKTRWLAAPRISLENGTLIRYADGAIMKSFYSKKLDREFEEVVFLGGVQVVKE